MDWCVKDMRQKVEKLEESLRNSIDYMLRYQWKDTRNLLNKALTKVAQPLQLKDLFYSNVHEKVPELYYGPPSSTSKTDSESSDGSSSSSDSDSESESKKTESKKAESKKTES